MTTDAPPAGDVGELVTRLRPSWSVDEPMGKLVSLLRSDHHDFTAEALNDWLVANNALKAEAASALTSLVAERDALARALEPFAAYGRQIKKRKPERNREASVLSFPIISEDDPIGTKYGEITRNDFLIAAQAIDLPAFIEAAKLALSRTAAAYEATTPAAAQQAVNDALARASHAILGDQRLGVFAPAAPLDKGGQP